MILYVSAVEFIICKQRTTGCVWLSVLSDLQFPGSKAILMDATLPVSDPSFRVRYTELVLVFFLCPLSSSLILGLMHRLIVGALNLTSVYYNESLHSSMGICHSKIIIVDGDVISTGNRCRYLDTEWINVEANPGQTRPLKILLLSGSFFLKSFKFGPLVFLVVWQSDNLDGLGALIWKHKEVIDLKLLSESVLV